MKICTLNLLIFLCIYSFSMSQDFPTGIYTDVAGSDKNIIFYSTNGINYVILKDNDLYYDDMVIRETMTHGLVRNNMEMNYTCGPFASYCRDGYFFNENGKSYYFDELLSAYEANVSEDPMDTLNYLYVKIDDLPVNWELKLEDRLCEIGILNNSILYEITTIAAIKKINTPKCPDCILIEANRPFEIDNKIFLLKESDFNQLELAKSPNFQLSNLVGKYVQMYFKWEEGKMPGYLTEEDIDFDNDKHNVPYDIQLLTENLNANSVFRYPIPKN